MSSLSKFLLGVAGLALASAAEAREYLTNVTSQVYQTQGTTKEIAQRASICIAQRLAPGTVDAQLIISSDLDGGMIVARNASSHGTFPEFKIRSRFTFEAREGRFRIEQSGIERFSDYASMGWGPIGKWPGSQWKSAEAAFARSAESVAQCVMSGPKKEDW